MVAQKPGGIPQQHGPCLVTLCHAEGLVVGAAACPAHGAAGAGAAAAAGLGTRHPAALSVAGVGDAAQVGKQVEGVAVQAVEASTLNLLNQLLPHIILAQASLGCLVDQVLGLLAAAPEAPHALLAGWHSIDDALLAEPAKVGHALVVHVLAGGLRLDCAKQHHRDNNQSRSE